MNALVKMPYSFGQKNYYFRVLVAGKHNQPICPNSMYFFLKIKFILYFLHVNVKFVIIMRKKYIDQIKKIFSNHILFSIIKIKLNGPKYFNIYL